MGGEERDREGVVFGEYMDATQEGTAYGGPDGGWRSVRDTWCNSHGRGREGQGEWRDPVVEEDSGDGSGEDSEGSGGGSEEGLEDELEEEAEEEAEHDSDEDFEIID